MALPKTGKALQDERPNGDTPTQGDEQSRKEENHMIELNFEDVEGEPNFTLLTNPLQDKVNEMAKTPGKWTRVKVKTSQPGKDGAKEVWTSEWVRTKVRAAANAINMGGKSKVTDAEDGMTWVYFTVTDKKPVEKE